MRDFTQKGYIRVTKTMARKLFKKGVCVYLIPVNTLLFNPWVTPLPLSSNVYSDFDHEVYFYEFYNCNNQLGRYCAYYISERDRKEVM